MSARPLYDTVADATYYVELGVEDHLRRSVAAGLNALILGERGSGKTSLAYQLAREMRQVGGQVIVLDGTVYADERALLEALYDELPRRRTSLTEQMAAASTFQYDLPFTTRNDPLGELDLLGIIEDRVKELRENVEVWRDPTPLFVIDGMPTPGDAHKLFGRHRDLVWRIPVNWVVTGSPDHRASYLRPPADSFFETVVELGGLGPSTQREILIKRLDKGTKVDATVYRPGSTPGELIARGRALLLEGKKPTDLRPGRRLAAIEAAGGRSAVMLAAEMASLGAVSASDDRLQRRLGWTRSRLSQVLRSLEEARLVRTSHAESTGPGRPQKLYELIEDVPSNKAPQ